MANPGYCTLSQGFPKAKCWTQGVSLRTRAAFTMKCNLKVDQQSCGMSICLHRPKPSN